MGENSSRRSSCGLEAAGGGSGDGGGGGGDGGPLSLCHLGYVPGNAPVGRYCINTPGTRYQIRVLLYLVQQSQV